LSEPQQDTASEALWRSGSEFYPRFFAGDQRRSPFLQVFWLPLSNSFLKTVPELRESFFSPFLVIFVFHINDVDMSGMKSTFKCGCQKRLADNQVIRHSAFDKTFHMRVPFPRHYDHEGKIRLKTKGVLKRILELLGSRLVPVASHDIVINLSV